MSPQSKAMIWSKFKNKVASPGEAVNPEFFLQAGGALAVYGESPVSASPEDLPWMVFHGGPGGRINSDLVKPLRELGLGWFGFDQRNSGHSEDLKPCDLDLQLFVDDALKVIDHLGCDQVNVLAGSWGATVAMMMAAQNPQKVNRMVLRAPFIPFASRIDHFFELLEGSAPDWFAAAFGVGARTFEVCSQILDNHDVQQQLRKAYCWSLLEEVALGIRNAQTLPDIQTGLSQLDAEQTGRLLRKYLLQSHFLVSSGFWAEGDWFKDMEDLDKSLIHVSIAQGLDDKVCPADGALIIKDLLTRVELALIKDCGHLAGSPNMDSTIKKLIEQHIE